MYVRCKAWIAVFAFKFVFKFRSFFPIAVKA